MTKEITQTADLGQGWTAQAYNDGSATVRNIDKGQRIDLPKESVDRFLDIWNKARPMTADDTFNSTTGN